MINRYYVVDILSQEPLSDVQTAILQYIAQHAATKYRIGKDLNIKSYSTVFNNVNQLLDADYIQIVKHGTRHAIYYGLTVTGLREIIADTNTVAGQIQLLLRHHHLFPPLTIDWLKFLDKIKDSVLQEIFIHDKILYPSKLFDFASLLISVMDVSNAVQERVFAEIANYPALQDDLITSYHTQITALEAQIRKLKAHHAHLTNSN